MFKMPAGRYWVGDPCYCFDGSWHKILDSSNYLKEPYYKDGVAVVCALSTAHGDGMYLDRQGRSYPVDAGLIGLVLCGEEDYAPGSRIVEFGNEIKCYVNDDVAGHVIVFDSGDVKIEIPTESEDEDNYDDEDEEDDQ